MALATSRMVPWDLLSSKKGSLPQQGTEVVAQHGTAPHLALPCTPGSTSVGYLGASLATGLHVPWGGSWLPASTGEIRVIVKNKQLEVYYQRTIFG